MKIANCLKNFMQEDEVWKDVVGYEGFFQVSSLGNIKSLQREVFCGKSYPRVIKEKPMGRSLNKDGYYKVSLRNGKTHKTPTLHRLVAEAFIPNVDNKPVVNHINGIKTDNRIENLEWCTVKENVVHAVKIGLQTGVLGEANHNCKITEENVYKIKKEYVAEKKTYAELGIIYGISPSQIGRIIKGQRWKHLK